MGIDIAERYKLMFTAHMHASDFRARILQGWFLIYTALAAVFAWMQDKSRPSSWVVSLLAFVATLVMWFADYRNRSALDGSKEAGTAIERHPSANIPEDPRFFARILSEREPQFLRKILRHSVVIDFMTVLVLFGLAYATYFLFAHKGNLLNSPPTNFYGRSPLH